MADENHRPPSAGGNIEIDARRVVAEVTVILESVAAGLEALRRLPEAILLGAQIDLQRGLVTRAAETVETFSETLARPSA